MCMFKSVYACMYMYDVLVDIGVGGGGRREGSDWLKAGD